MILHAFSQNYTNRRPGAAWDQTPRVFGLGRAASRVVRRVLTMNVWGCEADTRLAMFVT